MITNQKELRRRFWQDCGDLPGVSRRRITNYSGNGKMYNTDTRCTFCDWLDVMSKNGEVSEKLAHNATL